MNDHPTAAVPAEPTPPLPAADTPYSAGLPSRLSPTWGDARWWFGLAAVLAVLAGVSLVIAWKTQQRVKSVEQQLVRRLEESQLQASEARMLAKQSQDSVLAAAAKVALLEARVAEVAVQRSQLEELMQSLSRSRDENMLVDIDTGIRVAMQQTAITGSAEPLVAMLKQADDRLVRYDQPRLEGVRRAIARDLDRVKAVGLIDIPTLSIKLDEAVRLIDELPLLSNAELRPASSKARTIAAAAPAAVPVVAASNAAAAGRAASSPTPAWWQTWDGSWAAISERVWSEVKSLVRVTRIDHPESMLLSPDHAFFVRENVKLRLLNARLALLSRQFDTAQSDLQVVQTALDRYFDRGSRRTALASDLVRQVAAQARQVTVPKPDDTLVALAAATAGR
ncbi:MAG: uroporphyrinogen-III C-methyltransferase [Burkholderiaceae bacterium]|nr:uroporphyrinogen-III C-methyltransferase [Burkholderiaceae bacterium]